MTKLADDIRFVFEHGLSEQELREALQRSQTSTVSGLEVDYPGVTVFRDRAQSEIGLILKKAKAHFAGATPWSTGTEAILKTTDLMHKDCQSHLVMCMARGMAIGSHQEQYKNIALHNWDKDVFTAEGWQETVQMFATNLACDNEAIWVILDRFTDAFKRFADYMRIQHTKNRETLHVWDLWSTAMGSSSLMLFLQGQNLGKKWTEEAALEALLEGSNAGTD